MRGKIYLYLLQWFDWKSTVGIYAYASIMIQFRTLSITHGADSLHGVNLLSRNTVPSMFYRVGENHDDLSHFSFGSS